jgi:peptidyl-tRNA hydrolase, PTH2 family
MARRAAEVFLRKDPLKMVLLVRTDLGMSKGKACAQSAHAAVMGLDAARSGDPATQRLAAKWLASGQPKIVLRVGSFNEM